MKILTIDIGGSNIKANILDIDGVPVSEYKKLPTPQPATPANVLQTIKTLAKEPMVILLLVASLIYFISGETGDAIFLASAIIRSIRSSSFSSSNCAMPFKSICA